jgi:tRNA(Arg) A34 adenosine deaminase TadA
MEKLEEGGENRQANMSQDDLLFLREAIRLAEKAERSGNLPIGAVIVLDGQVIARGMNTIWQPDLELTKHAEMEALRGIPAHLRGKCKEMTLYSTLEPCVMCAGAILLHQVGRLVYGASDPYGGVGPCLESLPQYFENALLHTQWTGPALPVECDPLYLRVMELRLGR